MRRTSAAAWTAVQESDLIGKRQKQVYEILFQQGPLTGNEIARASGTPGLWKRCSELMRLGLIQEVGSRECSVTGSKCLLWDVTDQPPSEPDPRYESALEKMKKIAQRANDLFAQAADLKRQADRLLTEQVDPKQMRMF